MSLRWIVLSSSLALLAGCGRSGSFEGESWEFPRPARIPTLAPTPTPTRGTPVVPDDFGDGSDGDAVFSGGGSSPVNQCDRVLSASGTSASTSDSFGLPSGTRVLLLQAQEDVAGASGATLDVTNPGSVGIFEFARVASYSSFGNGNAVFEDPLVNQYASNGTRSAVICTVPEYASLTMSGGVSLVPPDVFVTGGIVALFVDGTLNISGSSAIHADARGAPGGDPSGTSGNNVDLDDTAAGDGGGKGAGVDRGPGPSCCGRGSVANAAGGGNGKTGGGGGGGNGGRGGFGGSQKQGESTVVDARGRAGGAVMVAASDLRAVLGGGGGAGHEESDNQAGRGGDGGGLVFVFARTLSGSPARISADGEAGTSTANGGGGGGGGGAGGTVIIVVETDSYGGVIHAQGGNGGNVPDSSAGALRGPGGGGGGGRIYARGVAAGSVTPGTNGTNTNVGNAPHGATAGLLGTAASY